MNHAPVDLFDHIHEESTIKCSKCPGIDIIKGYATISSTEFFEKGWRLVKDKVLCPDCVGKLKKK